MTLAATGQISVSDINVERGVSSTTQTALSWLQSNTRYAYKDMNSIHGYAWFTAVSSKNSVSPTPSGLFSNCTNSNCTQLNNSGFDGAGGWTNCNIIANCNQCSYSHGTYLQANCNCNCNCASNCSYNNCNCNCNCTCS